MNENNYPSSKNLRILGCLAIDIAIIVAYFKAFGLFFIVAPIKSSLVFFILFIGLLFLNAIIILPNKLFKLSGLPYSIFTVMLFVLYAVAANVISVYFVIGSIIWYVVWELILLAVFLVTLSYVISFSKRNSNSLREVEKENNEKSLVMLYILEIEDILATKKNEESIRPCLNQFKALKDRIMMSTPFGRINGNNMVLEIENRVKDNLIFLKENLSGNLTDEQLIEIQDVIEDTRKLVINRETLNIK